MIYQDRIYGEIKIKEPVILELIESRPIQRLKEIDQAGYPPLRYNPNSVSLSELRLSRFEHSVGVCYLLKKFEASLEEQIAGLIHDVSHAVFSHCVDYALDAGSPQKQNHQDNIFKNFIENTEIPDILKRHKFDSDYILNEHNFPLLERSLPDLCADRIDYSLRESSVVREINKETSDYFLENLMAKNNKWIFKSFESARRYAELFLKMNTFYFAGTLAAVMLRTVGDILRHALQKGYIYENDLYTTDKEVLDKIKQFLAKDEKLKLLWDRMNNKVKFENNPQNYDAHVFCKSRMVDSLFEENGRVQRISEKDLKWKEILKKELKPKEYFIKFEK